jgi:hypothetical protein
MFQLISSVDPGGLGAKALGRPYEEPLLDQGFNAHHVAVN